MCSILIVVAVSSMIPPRKLTSLHFIGYALFPVGIFFAAKPGVPIRRYAYFALIVSAFFILVGGYHIMGTSYFLGLGEGMKIYVVPSLLSAGLAFSSVAAAKLRLGVNDWMKEIKNNTRK